jgi:hypothetical protein
VNTTMPEPHRKEFLLPHNYRACRHSRRRLFCRGANAL